MIEPLIHFASLPAPAARRSKAPVDQVELSTPAVVWSAEEKKKLKQSFKKLRTRSLDDEGSRKMALSQLMRQESLGKSPAEASEFIEKIAHSASTKGLIEFYYERFWEDLEVCSLHEPQRRDAYLGMLEDLFGNQEERLSRWQLIDQSKVDQPWPVRAEAMATLLSSTTLKGLSRVGDACRLYHGWEKVVQAGADPNHAGRILKRVGEQIVSASWSDSDQREADFQALEEALIKLAPVAPEAMEATVRALEKHLSQDLFWRVVEYDEPQLTPATRLLPRLEGLETEVGDAWLDTYDALLEKGTDPVVASFALQQHLTREEVRQGPGPEDPAAEADRLKQNLVDALQIPEPGATAGVQVGQQTVTVGSVRLPVRQPSGSVSGSEAGTASSGAEHSPAPA